MAVKYIFVTGGVVSGLGKGITAASLGRLLKARGYKVTMQKFDPYINIDPGTMNPVQHGEVFVTDDGAETDLDLGHYERFIDESLTKASNVTTGKVYYSVLEKERKGEYGGGTVQVIPHITDEIKSRFHRQDEKSAAQGKLEIAIIEVGGTVGDIESQPFLEAIRQFRVESGPGNTMLIHVTLVPYLACSRELKSKPTQASVRELRSIGLQPDVVVCRSEVPLTDSVRGKISQFCNVPREHVIENTDMDILYEVPLALEREHLAEIACKVLDIPCPVPDLSGWEQMVYNRKHPDKTVRIALVGKYVELHDAYLSVAEALSAAAAKIHARVQIDWVDSESLEKNGQALDQDAIRVRLGNADGVLVPGGFGSRGIPGKLAAIRFARENGTPFLGICLGMQMAMVEFARDVLGWEGASSAEFDPDTPYPIIHLMPDQEGVVNLGGTLRLGAWPCVLKEDSMAAGLFGKTEIYERHRHRYEVNNDYRADFEKAGMNLCGLSPDGRIVEMVELKDHPYFIGTQGHPEFRSRPDKPHPLFLGLLTAASQKKQREETGN